MGRERLQLIVIGHLSAHQMTKKEAGVVFQERKKGHGMSLRRHTMTSILKRDNRWLSRPPGLLYLLYRLLPVRRSSRFC